MRRRIVIDTNIYVSRFLREASVPGQAVARIWRETIPLISIAAWEELRVVLMRPKFAPYVKPGKLEPFLTEVWDYAEHILPSSIIRACRDPKDDKFLELAVDGRADGFLTGDKDLLALHPFRGIPILTPAAYLELK
jgi:putative PIN family toxin of toxin-antitoxin system